jgi:hypothetical protein
MMTSDFGDVIDMYNPNAVSVAETAFSQVRESPVKMSTANAMAILQLELDIPVFGLHWALAKIAAFSAHQACDYFTDFAVAGCEGATKTRVLNMKKFFNESNHDINRNRILGTRDPTIGPLMIAVLRAYDVGVAAMARKKTLFDVRHAINDTLVVINAIREDPGNADDYRKTETALLKGCQSYKEREDGAFLRNLQGAKMESLGQMQHSAPSESARWGTRSTATFATRSGQESSWRVQSLRRGRQRCGHRCRPDQFRS